MAINNLPITVQTPADVQAVTDFLKSAIATSVSKKTIMPKSDVPVDSQKWAISFVKDTTPKGLETGEKEFTQVVKDLPEVEIISAQPLTQELLSKIVSWLRTEINPLIIVRPGVRRDIIGGLILRTGRHSYDLSVAEGLDQSQTALSEVIHGWA